MELDIRIRFEEITAEEIHDDGTSTLYTTDDVPLTHEEEEILRDRIYSLLKKTTFSTGEDGNIRLFVLHIPHVNIAYS